MAPESNKMARKTLRTSYISTVVSIALVLFMIGTLGVLILHARKISNYVKENIQLSVMLLPDAGLEEVGKLVKSLEQSKFVKSSIYITKDEAAAKLKEDLGEDFVDFLGYNPLLGSIDVKLKAEYADMESVNTLKATIITFPVVKEVYYQQSLIDMINKNMRTLTLIILGFSALLFFVAAALINNTIRLSLYSRRLLIKSMKLVGATRGFIRKPFVLGGIMPRFYGAVIANMLLAVLLYFSKKEIPDLVEIQDFNMVLILMVGVILAGIVIAGLSTFFAVNKYLRRSTQDLY
ncbi:MAG: cell division protein FtsX [Bacteroidetes bacterium]|nr:cell division protein FtsX [Bacteroidota bacterium]